MTKPLFFRATFLFAIAMLIGTYTYLFLSAPYLFAKNREALSEVQKIATTGSRLVHGAIVSVDVQNRTLDMVMENPFQSGTVVQLKLKILSPVHIARQQLLPGPDGAYSALSDEAVISLADIRAGERTAILVSRDSSGALGTHYILLGNPL